MTKKIVVGSKIYEGFVIGFQLRFVSGLTLELPCPLRLGRSEREEKVKKLGELLNDFEEMGCKIFGRDLIKL